MNIDKTTLITETNELVNNFVKALTSTILSKDEKIAPLAVSMFTARNKYLIFKNYYPDETETLDEMVYRIEIMDQMLAQHIISRMNGHWNPKPIEIKPEKKIIILVNGKEL